MELFKQVRSLRKFRVNPYYSRNASPSTTAAVSSRSHRGVLSAAMALLLVLSGSPAGRGRILKVNRRTYCIDRPTKKKERKKERRTCSNKIKRIILFRGAKKNVAKNMPLAVGGKN